MTALIYDVVVVGAGIVGAACAEECARQGMRVAIIDRDVIGGGATAHPSRKPGKRLFDRLVTKTVRCGMSRASGHRSGERKPYVSSSTTVSRYLSAIAAI